MPIAQTRLETLQICKLLQCVREQDRAQIEKLVISGIPHLINYNEPSEGETALCIAANQNNDSMIEFLLTLGAHPDVVDFKGRSALMRAAEFGNVECVTILTKSDADTQLTDLEGQGVLFYCLTPTQRHKKCLELLINYGADVNNISKDGKHVFVAACEEAKSNEESCMLMLQKGADPNAKWTKHNRTAVMNVCLSGSEKMLAAMLERGGEVNEIQWKVRTHASHDAAREGHLNCLKVLSAYGATFNHFNDKGNSPIHAAAISGHEMCVKYLSQRGCNPKPKNADGNTAKICAKEHGNKPAMKEAKKAEKSFGKTGKNNSPWALALYDFCCHRIKMIQESFTKMDIDGTGCLMKDDFLEVLENIGAPLPQVEVDIKVFLAAHDKGKDVGLDYNDFLAGKKYINKQYLMSAFEGKKKKKKGGKGKKGKAKIPMPICTQDDGPRTQDGGPPEMYLQRHIHFTDTGRFDRDQPPEHPLQDDSGWYLQRPDKTYINVTDAARHADLDTIRDAINRGVSVDTRDKYFKTPLMIACGDGNIRVVKFLVEHGADVNLFDNFKWSALHFACHSGMTDVVEYLVDNGANMEWPALNKATPIMRAIEASKNDVVDLLMQRGAKIQIENRRGFNSVDKAAEWADPRIYEKVLLKFASIPKPKDKKNAKKPGNRSDSPAKEPPGITRDSESPRREDQQFRQRKGSILRAASALAGGIDEQEDITYVPIKTWTSQPSSKELIKELEVRRERFGWEVDFQDFEMPFSQNATKRVNLQGGFEE